MSNSLRKGFEVNFYFVFKIFIIVDLQFSVNFCCKVTQLCIYIYAHTHTHSFSHIILYHVPSQVIRYSSLCYAAGARSLLYPKCIMHLVMLSMIHVSLGEREKLP